MKNSKIKKSLVILLVLCIVITSLYYLQKLVMPKYMEDIVEGALIAEYYAEENKDHDVIFIGDCEVYENFVPAVLWQEYGINSYIRGSAQQLIWQSYYLMEETLKYEKPDVIVFNVLSLKYDEPQKEEYNRMTLDGMKWSTSKLASISASMLENEALIEYVFPLLRYHSRITDLQEEDFKYLNSKDTVAFNGYYMRVDVKAAGEIPTAPKLADYTLGENAMSYLQKMVALCEEHGVELVLIKAPSLYPHWYDEWEVQVEQFAKENDVEYINFLELIEECELDFNTDTYDGGLHLNLSGATKASLYFGNYLQETYGIENRQGESILEKAWKEKLIDYEAEIQRQMEELK